MRYAVRRWMLKTDGFMILLPGCTGQPSGDARRAAHGRGPRLQPGCRRGRSPRAQSTGSRPSATRPEKRLQSELGVTTIYVTHHQAEAMTLADRVAIMRFGLLQ